MSLVLVLVVVIVLVVCSKSAGGGPPSVLHDPFGYTGWYQGQGAAQEAKLGCLLVCLGVLALALFGWWLSCGPAR